MGKRDRASIWMPLYVSDWDDDTRDLTCEQDGAYGRLVRHYWRKGPLPDDDATLAQIVSMERARWRKVRPKIAPFFVIRDGFWFHKRVEEELQKASEIIEKRRQAGLRGGRPRKQELSNEKPNASVLLSENVDFEKQTKTPARVEVDRSEITHSLSQEISTDYQVGSTAEVIPLAARSGRA